MHYVEVSIIDVDTFNDVGEGDADEERGSGDT